MTDASEEFSEWVHETVCLGLEVVATDCRPSIWLKSDTHPNEPFTVAAEDENGEEVPGVIVSRECVSEIENADFYGIMWHGKITDETGRTVDALLFEAGERGGPAFLYAQKYKQKKAGALVQVGHLLVINQIQNVWSDHSESDAAEPRQPDPVESLEDLTVRAIDLALTELGKGVTDPFVCLVDPDEEALTIIRPNCEGRETGEILDSIREHIAGRDEFSMYAIVYLAKLNEGGKLIKAVFAETGERCGEAPLFALRYKLNKSGELKLSQVEFLEQTKNLWDASSG